MFQTWVFWCDESWVRCKTFLKTIRQIVTYSYLAYYACKFCCVVPQDMGGIRFIDHCFSKCSNKNIDIPVARSSCTLDGSRPWDAKLRRITKEMARKALLACLGGPKNAIKFNMCTASIEFLDVFSTSCVTAIILCILYTASDIKIEFLHLLVT